MMTSSYSGIESNINEFGIIILGNSGAGKSFITNIILDKEISKNDYSNQFVSRRSEFQEIIFGNNHYAIYDTPGLIEVDQRRIDTNKQSISRAFTEQSKSIVIYIFRTQNNCIRDEDFIAFTALNAAYSFNVNSLLFVVNNLSENRPKNFEGQIMFTIGKICHVPVLANKICFLNHVDIKNSTELKFLKIQMLRGIVELLPQTSNKTNGINLSVDDIIDHKRYIAQIFEKYAKDNFIYSKVDIENLQIAYDSFTANQKCDFKLTHVNMDLTIADSNKKYEGQATNEEEYAALITKRKGILNEYEKLKENMVKSDAKENQFIQQKLEVLNQQQMQIEKQIQGLKQSKGLVWLQNSPIVDFVHILMGMNEASDTYQLGDIIVPNLKPIQADHIVEFDTNPKNAYSSKPSVPEIKYQTFGSNQNIQIHCLHVAFDEEKLFPRYKTKIFQDDLIFVNNTLKVEDRRLFLIIATKVAAYIVPLIEKHFCVENIYLFSPPTTEMPQECSEISEKIIAVSSDLKELCEKINDDIVMTSSRPLYDHRPIDIFIMLHTQKFNVDRKSITPMTDKLYNQWIVILHCDKGKNFGINKSSIPVIGFIDVINCIQFITNHSDAELFLVIMDNKKSDALRKMYDSEQVKVIYFFGMIEPDHTNSRSRLSGSFNSIEDLAIQLHQDISFFREQYIHTARIGFFENIDQKKQLIPQLNNKHKNFLLFNLFIDILTQTPLLAITKDYIENASKILLNTSTAQQKKTIEYEQLIKWDSYPELSEIVLTFHYLNRLDDVLKFHSELINMKQNTSDASLSHTVYVTKIISKNDFNWIKMNGVISIGIFLIATKSLLTARNIARQAAKYGLIPVLFQIEVIYNTVLLGIDGNRVVFRLGSVFRVKSVKKGSDGVQYVKLKCADSDFRLIKKQLQFEIGTPLTWKSFGNYLYHIKLYKQALVYFEYLLQKLSDDIHRASICNNIGLVYTMAGIEDKARKYYEQALKYAGTDNSVSTSAEHQDDFCIQRPPSEFTSSSDPIAYSTILGGIADVYYEKNDRKKAFEFYQKAFETSTDPHSLLYYQQMIINLSKIQS